MSLEITGKLFQILPEQSGSSKTGNSWRKQEFVLETNDQYPKKICINLWGEKISMLQNIGIGDDMKVFFDVESREYQGKWYTDVKAWKVEALNSTQNPTSSNQNTPIPQDPFPDDLMSTTPSDDLPF